MKTIQLSKYGNDNFYLTIDVNFSARVTKNLLADDGSVKLEGKTLPYNFNGAADQTDEAKQAKATLQSTIEEAFATYYNSVNMKG